MKKLSALIALAAICLAVLAQAALAWVYPPNGYPWCYPAVVGKVTTYNYYGNNQGTFRCEWNPNAPPPSTRWVRIGP